MHNIHIAGTGIWYPDNMITNDELVHSYNSYVDQFNEKNKIEIDNGAIEPMLHSSSDFIEKASGIETRYVIDKEGTLDTSRMMPRVSNEDENKLSVHAEVGIIAANRAM
jgi:beta-ketodecanoyl-[acyl-carrier-protein] synthase